MLFWHYAAGLKARGADVLHVLLLEPGNGSAEDVNRYRAELGGEGFAVVMSHADAFVDTSRRVVRARCDVATDAIETVTDFAPDVALCLDVKPLMVAQRAPRVPTLVWLGDLAFQTSWYHARYAAAERRRSSVRLPGAALRARAWRRAYREALTSAEDVVVASHSSVAELAALGIASTYLPYPWPVENGELPRIDKPEQPTFLFLGTMEALGSRSAFHFLFDRVYPLLLQQWGPAGFRILVAGRGRVPAWAVEGMRRRSEFEHLGFVEDLDPLLASVHAVLAPIDVPVGNRSRILTAAAKGALVVAHRNAALGNPALVDDRTCYLANDAAQFAERMRRAVDDPQGAARISAAARQSYLEAFEPHRAVSALLSRLDPLQPGAGRR